MSRQRFVIGFACGAASMFLALAVYSLWEDAAESYRRWSEA